MGSTTSSVLSENQGHNAHYGLTERRDRLLGFYSYLVSPT